MYIDIVPNRNSPPTILLRESYREGKTVRKRTIANITKWPKNIIDGLRLLLSNRQFAPVEELFTIEESIPHGHVEAVLGTIRKLRLDTILSSKPCRELNLVIAMIAERLIDPCSKLATTRLWHATTLANELKVTDADVDELYQAMDWLLLRQKRIEKKLAGRHLSEGSLVLYDTSSSYYEGRTCPLAQYGHNRDGKKGKPIIVYGVMTDKDGCPVAVDVYPGNTGDPTTVPDQVEKLKKRFGLSKVILVGDRGMLTQTQIDKLKEYPGLSWISALKGKSIRGLVEGGSLQLSLFDKQNLAEISSPEYPGERLIACFNPFLAEERHRKRNDLLSATQKELDKIKREVKRRTRKILNKTEIGLKTGKVVNKYKVGKHFILTIDDGVFNWNLNEESIKREAYLDGIYIIRTNEKREQISAEETVRSYKMLSQVEQAFRSFKGVELLIRPIHHRTPNHVRAHIFICMLSYYVEWHMRKTLAPLLFDDDELSKNREIRDPVAPAKPSASAKKKKIMRKTPDGNTLHSFTTLIKELGKRCKNRCTINSIDKTQSFYQNTKLNPIQKEAFRLLDVCPVNGI